MSFRTALSTMEVPLSSVWPWQRQPRWPLRGQGCARVTLPCSAPCVTMNHSEAQPLTTLLRVLLWELHHASNTSAAPPGSSSGADGSLYILAHILAYTCWQKLESKHDPYHLHIERDWGSGDTAQGVEKGGPP